MCTGLQILQMHTGTTCNVTSRGHGIGKLAQQRQSVRDMSVTSPATSQPWEQTSSSGHTSAMQLRDDLTHNFWQTQPNRFCHSIPSSLSCNLHCHSLATKTSKQQSTECSTPTYQVGTNHASDISNAVDEGNSCGSCCTLKEGCRVAVHDPIRRPSQCCCQQ